MTAILIHQKNLVPAFAPGTLPPTALDNLLHTWFLCHPGAVSAPTNLTMAYHLDKSDLSQRMTQKPFNLTKNVYKFTSVCLPTRLNRLKY